MRQLSLKTKIIVGTTAIVVLVAVVVLVILVTGDKNDSSGGNDPTFSGTPTSSTSGESTKAPGSLEPTPTPTGSTTPTASSPASTPTPTKKTTETFYAYITAWRGDMAAYQSFAFDYVDWLTGPEAVEKYMQDHPGVSQAEAQDEVEEYGYIRNADTAVGWFMPTDSTEYYIRDESTHDSSISVDYQGFRAAMIPALDDNDTVRTFVKVTVSGENFTRVEWVFHP